MHILMTTDTVGGVWTYTRELVAGLLRRGHRVTLISFGKLPSSDQTEWMQGLRRLEYRPTTFRLEWMQDSAEDIEQSTAFLQEVVRDLSPDLLHFNQYAYGALQTEIPKLVVAHSDVVSWWVGVHGCEPPQNAWIRWYRELVTKGLSSAELVVAPSNWMMEAAKAYYATPATSKVIYNARDASLFDAEEDKENSVISAGRLWDQAKQTSLLLQHKHSVPVFIAGSLEHPEKLAGGRASCDLGAGISLLGSLSEAELSQRLARSSIYCATSCYEPFGLATLEAALSGCALIANDIPTFHELWGDAACYFRKNDAGSLAARIEVLSRDARLRRHYARKALDRARTMFSLDRMLNTYEALYSGLVTQETFA